MRGALRRSALSVQASEEQPKAPALKEVVVAAPKSQSAKTYEEAVQASGLLNNREPGKTGDGGRDSYVVQPMQLLSLYPRCTTFTCHWLTLLAPLSSLLDSLCWDPASTAARRLE